MFYGIHSFLYFATAGQCGVTYIHIYIYLMPVRWVRSMCGFDPLHLYTSDVPIFFQNFLFKIQQVFQNSLQNVATNKLLQT
jgi:hypothetical protein